MQVACLLCSAYPHPPHAIMLSASLSSVFHTKFTYQNWNENKHFIWMAIKLRPAVPEFSFIISKFHALTDSEHKFHKARIENGLPIEVELGFPWLRIDGHNHGLGTCWLGISLLGTYSSTTETVQGFTNPTSITYSCIGLRQNKNHPTLA